MSDESSSWNSQGGNVTGYVVCPLPNDVRMSLMKNALKQIAVVPCLTTTSRCEGEDNVCATCTARRALDALFIGWGS